MYYQTNQMKKTTQPKKQIVTINIPDQYINAMDTMVKLGMTTSRSEVVREALRQFFEKDIELREDLETRITEIFSTTNEEILFL